MRRLAQILKRFRKDESGSFIVLFGVLAIVLIATAGAVVDFTGVQQARTRSQTALDAAALALQPRITIDSNDVLKQKATKILEESLNDDTITAAVTLVTTDTTEGSIKLDASITVPTYFVGLIGIPDIDAKLVSEATRKQLDLEVAMVLDNSMSMNSNSRMTNLKAAANCAVNVLLNGNCASTATTTSVSNVKIGIVPFTEFVNIGNSNANKTAAWMTQTGNTKASRDGFDGDDDDSNTYSTAVNRFSLYTQMGVSWDGCVEARDHVAGTGGLYYDESDLPADTLTPESMFVPTFAPDQPDSGGYSNNYMSDRPSVCTNKDQGSWVQVKSKTNCTSNGNNNAGNYNACTATPTTTTTQKDKNGSAVTPAAATEPATVNGQPKVCTDAYTSNKTQNSPARWTNTYTRSCSYNFSDRELQERICKYNTTTNSISSTAFQSGPNADCGVALLPLTSTKSSITSKITAIGPDGGTNIHQGVMWGFHMLSNDAPLTEAKVYDPVTSKVLILMTDGENTTSTAGMNAGTAGNSSQGNFTGGEWYLAYGYPYSRRLDTSGVTGTTWTALQTEMDNRTKATCTNAKAKGIIVYTIGLATASTSNPTAVTNMLKACATDINHAYFPAQPSDLTDVFKTIAQQLADLRLAL